MILDRIAVTGLRNLDHFEIRPAPTINWISGLNGAGKTSILEAIMLLSRGRVLNNRRRGTVLGVGRELLEVSALLRSRDPRYAQDSSLKFSYSRSGSNFVENGKPVASVHLLRNRFHVRMLAGNAQQLLEGPPLLRRLFLDWNLFHVEPRYGRLLADLKKITLQRNAWLRSGAKGPPVWDQEYCRLSQVINLQRRNLVAGLNESLVDLAQKFALDDKIGLEFHEGWPVERGPLDDLVTLSVREDALRGYTYYGASRADLSLRLPSRSCIPSRGETKLFVFLLQLAAQHYWNKHGGPEAVWLLDDLGAELDSSANQKILAALSHLSAQVIVTVIAGKGSRPPVCAEGPVFHVEQGKLVGQY